MAKKTDQDPAGQRVSRTRTSRKLQQRLALAEKEILRSFRAVPRTRRTEAVISNRQVVYDYDLTPEQQEDLQIGIRDTLDESLETTGMFVPLLWWYKPEVEQPYRQGTLEELNRFNVLIGSAIALGLVGLDRLPPQVIAPEVLLSSQPYLESLRSVYVQNYGTIKSLSNRTADQVIQRINAGLSAGNSPTDIAKEIRGRFDVSDSNAKRIANTEINRAYNNGKMDAVELAAKESGLRAGVIHISALLQTTRKTHAKRHGKAFTVEEQRSWWDSGSNRIQCKCTTRSILLDSKGRVVQREEQQEITDQGLAFFN